MIVCREETENSCYKASKTPSKPYIARVVKSLVDSRHTAQYVAMFTPVRGVLGMFGSYLHITTIPGYSNQPSFSSEEGGVLNQFSLRDAPLCTTFDQKGTPFK